MVFAAPPGTERETTTMRRRSLDSPDPDGRIATDPPTVRRRVFLDTFPIIPGQSSGYSALFAHSPARASRVRRRAAALALAVTTLLVGAGGPARAVAHGSAVPDGKYAFAVKLTDIGIPTPSGGRRDSSCSGALIAPHWVLTAGHCFRDVHDARVSRPVADKSTATVGRTDLTSRDGHDANVVAVRQHGTADISLARLDRAITDIKPLRVSRARPKVGQSVRLTGFGLTTAKAKNPPTRLLTGKFQISSVAQLEIGMTGTAPHADTSPCPHDSGGPYFTEAADGTATAVGVVSHGPDCPHTGADMAARIDAVAPWILSVVGPDLAARPSPSVRRSSAPPSFAAAAPLPAGHTATRPYWLVVPAAVLAILLVALVSRGRRRRGVHRHT
jgi:hypothetical protein